MKLRILKKATVIGLNQANREITIKYEDGTTEIVSPDSLKSIKKASEAKPGNPTELETQSDGASVGIKEASQFVKARIKDSSKIYSTNKDKQIMVRALDYTSRGENEDVEILTGSGKSLIVKKKDVELLETGVYNDQKDSENNPKTGENKSTPEVVVLNKIQDITKDVIGQISELRNFIKKETNLSIDALESSLSELENYSQSLQGHLQSQTETVSK